MSSLVLSSTLFAGVAIAQGLGAGEILRIPAENAAYCHMKFSAMREDTILGEPGLR